MGLYQIDLFMVKNGNQSDENIALSEFTQVKNHVLCTMARFSTVMDVYMKKERFC